MVNEHDMLPIETEMDDKNTSVMHLAILYCNRT